MNDFSLAPDVNRARRLDRSMRLGFADSVQHLSDVVQSKSPSLAKDLGDLVARIRQGEVLGPSAFALYFEAAGAMLENDPRAAQPLLEALARSTPIDGAELQILRLGECGDQATITRYQQHMDSDPDTHFAFADPSERVATEAVDRVSAALQIIRQASPALFGEIEALVRQLILVGSGPDSTSTFAGGSAYSLWGALFLNSEHHSDVLSVVEAIAHESAHSLLFGFCLDEPLVLNPDTDLFPSPLRADPRPMDGIFHATYVSARMHWTLDALLAGGVLDKSDTARVTEMRDADRQSFFDGLRIIESHGQLTEIGSALIGAANDYMAAALGR